MTISVNCFLDLLRCAFSCFASGTRAIRPLRGRWMLRRHLCRKPWRRASLFLRFENGVDDEIDRLRGAQSTQIGPDVAALAVDRVAGSTTEVGAPENLRAALRVALAADLAREFLDLRRGELPRFAAQAGGP